MTPRSRDAGWVDRAATQLAGSRLRRTRLARLATADRPQTEVDAYTVQDRVHELLEAGGLGRPVGHKIGCTTPVMQAYLGIPNPCAGSIFEPTVRHLDGEFASSAFLRVGVECEIAVSLGADLLRPRDSTFTIDEVAAAVRGCMAAIELVEDRYVDYPSLDTPTLIADDFFNAGCVLGEERPLPPQRLDETEGRMEINGVEVGRGTGADVLGHPLEALRWLATAGAMRGRPLRAGTFVLLGSLVQTNWIEPGDVVSVDIEPLGPVRLHLSPAA